MAICMVSTTDNKFDYFTEFEQWNQFDKQKGYNTLSYLARLVRIYDDQTPESQEEEIEKAVDDIVRLNLTGNYIKVYPREGDNVKPD